ncbi:hypothetical protein EJ04DRAFT_571087 [Polyplosphaeria fusca]|uniref:S-adenosyl-L-methionine-dependent methyltransferase n=1 Tax=Polyplosphaeria fusca TaxID=682080 RepID=A0A9P4QHN7_9PLEO|nr:hypothetical protein EJ04DRAFT_571087 [Polyplosphaeria fusca]
MSDTDDSSGTGGQEYVLGRDYLASVRLNLQHYLWVQETGYHVHPSITLKPGMEVMEVATGTAIWSLDLATKHPDIRFLATDYSLDQAPPPEFLPRNVELAEWDLLDGGVPEEYIGRFDVVHVRLMMCVIKNNDPSSVVEKLVKILKPGGYLQWGEMDHTTHRMEHALPNMTSESFEQAVNFPSTLGRKDKRMNQSWVSTLSSRFQAVGLFPIADVHAFRNKSHLSFYTDAAFLVWNEWREGMSASDKETYGGILGKAKREREEQRKGLALNMEIRTVVGMK